MDTDWVKITEELLRLAVDVVVGVIVGYAIYLFARKRDEVKYSEERKNYQRQIEVGLHRNRLLEIQIANQERHRDEDRTEHENEQIRAELLEGVDAPDSLEKAIRVARFHSDLKRDEGVYPGSPIKKISSTSYFWFFLFLLILCLIVALIVFILR